MLLTVEKPDAMRGVGGISMGAIVGGSNVIWIRSVFRMMKSISSPSAPRVRALSVYLLRPSRSGRYGPTLPLIPTGTEAEPPVAGRTPRGARQPAWRQASRSAGAHCARRWPETGARRGARLLRRTRGVLRDPRRTRPPTRASRRPGDECVRAPPQRSAEPGYEHSRLGR